MEERRRELSNRTELSMGVGELREKLNAWGGDKIRKASGEEIGKKKLAGFGRQFKRKARPKVLSGKNGHVVTIRKGE